MVNFCVQSVGKFSKDIEICVPKKICVPNEHSEGIIEHKNEQIYSPL